MARWLTSLTLKGMVVNGSERVVHEDGRGRGKEREEEKGARERGGIIPERGCHHCSAPYQARTRLADGLSTTTVCQDPLGCKQPYGPRKE